MKPTEPIPMEENDGRQLLEDELKWREREDYHTWLDEVEKEELRSIVQPMDKMFNEIFTDSNR